MARTGIDRRTGAVITGWAHCAQSIGVIITTRIGTRVMRRAFGSLVPRLQDANASRRTLLELYVAVADALAKYEPGFRLKTIELVAGGRDGLFRFEIAGLFYPRGHLGDWSAAEPQSTALPVSVAETGYAIVSEAA